MAYRPLVAIPAYPHHIIPCGNNRQAIFFPEDEDHFYITAP